MSHRIDVLAYDGCFAAEVFGLTDLLTIGNAVSRALLPGVAPPFRARVVSVRGGPVELAGGAILRTEQAGGSPDQLVVPGFEFTDVARLDERLAGWAGELAYLRTLADRGTAVASLCVGAFLLAEAGLLDGHTATTSWLYAPELARRHARVNVRATGMIVQDGRITTSGAFSAAHDLALHLVGVHAGERVARTTSSITLVAATRRSQAPFVDEALLPVPHAGFCDDVRQWLRRHQAEPYDLTRLATAFNVSSRTMLRRFAAETGQSPLSFLQATRVATAKRLLETSDLSVHAITGQVGYADAATFRKLFTGLVGVTPSAYRRQFARAAVTG